MDIRDKIGTRGELLFATQLTYFDRLTGPLFRPRFLGDKWPILDFLVECDGAGNAAPFFFVQVKATQGAYTRAGHLKAAVSAGTAQALAAHPAPTYIVGVDVDNEKSYIISANSIVTRGLSSISTQWEINPQTRESLWDEVTNYWNGQSAAGLRSNFNDLHWR